MRQTRYLALVFTVLHLAVACAADSLQETLDVAYRSVSRLRTIEYTATSSMKYGDLTVTHEMYFAAKADMFRCETKLRNSRGEVMERVLAYDHTHYQELDRVADRLSLSTKHHLAANATFGTDGLGLAYQFLFLPFKSKKGPEDRNSSVLSWLAVRDPGNWNNARAYGTVVRTNIDEHGDTTVVVAFELDEPDHVRVEVDFARGKSGFPVRTRIMTPAGVVVGEAICTDFVSFEGDDDVFGVVPLGLKVRNLATNQIPELTIEWSADRDSLRINHDIEDSIFTLSKTSAATTVDVDKWEDDEEQRVAELDERLGNKPKSNTPRSASSSYRGTLLSLNIGAVLLIVVVVIFLRRRGDNR